MIFDPEIYCTAAETAELDGTAPLALAGDGLWVGVLSRGACLLDGVDRPGQSGDILLGPAPLVLTPQSDCHLLAVRLTGHCTDAYLLQLGAARWAEGAACPGAAELIAQLCGAQTAPMAYALLCAAAKADETARPLPPLVAEAVAAFRAKTVNRIILTRPAVEAGERLGFLPGDLQNKVDPYLRPLYDALFDMLGPETYGKYLERGNIEVAPLAYMRGRTLDNAFVILDEAQNTTLPQIKMFLTRMGRNAKFIVTGDVTQIDLPRRSDSGLTRAIGILRDVKGIGVVEFDRRDIVRHELVKHIVEAFDRHGESEAPPVRTDRKS